MNASRRLLQHFAAALAYRTQKAIRGAPDGFADFRAGTHVRTPHELLWHMTSVIGYARTFLHGGTFSPGRMSAFEDEIDRFHDTLGALRDDLSDPSLTAAISDEQFLQGPLSDAMTHAGQLAMLRRMAGSPVASENFIFAHISADNVSATQAEPAAPDAWWRPDMPPMARPDKIVEPRAGADTSSAARIAAVVLAAGGSARMGHPKQLILHDGEPLVARAARFAVESGADPVIVVLGANAAEIEAVLPRETGITPVVNTGWTSGLASSLATGLHAAARDESRDGVLVMLADQPLVDGDTLRPLIAAFRAGARLVASGYDGVPGVPAIFGKEHFPALLRLEGDAGAGGWLRSRLPEVTVVPVEGAAFDLDTPSDSAKLARTGNPG